MQGFFLFMYFVYVIYSKLGDCYYRGFTEHLTSRIKQHNNSESRFTSKYTDWEYFHIECFNTKKEALIREKKLKKYSKSQIIQLSLSSKNKITEVFLD